MVIVKNMPDMLLVELPPWDPRVPPLGLAYIATFLKSKNFNVKVFDLNIEMYNSEGKNQRGWGNKDYFWWKNDKIIEEYADTFHYFAEKILSFNAQIIGFSATLPSTPFLNYLLKILKEMSPDVPIIVGGPATFFQETRRDFNCNLIDYFVIGEGEIALSTLLNGLINRSGALPQKFSFCKTWKDNPDYNVLCIQALEIPDIDSLLFPGFEDFYLPSYSDGHFTLPLIFSKGCTRHCTFCSDTVMSKPYRCRKAKSVVEEIITHLKRYEGINTFRLNDLSFNANLKFLDEFCGRIISEGLNIHWYGQAQVRPDMNDKLLAKMKKAGCRQFDLGLESFSDNVLSMMKKGYNCKQAAQFLKSVKEAGIETNVLFIVGYPGETEADFDTVIEVLKNNKHYIDRIGSLNICGMPIGSELRCFPEKYKFYFLPNGDWETHDRTNTLAVRKRRYRGIIECCNKLNIPVEGCIDIEIYEKQFNHK